MSHEERIKRAAEAVETHYLTPNAPRWETVSDDDLRHFAEKIVAAYLSDTALYEIHTATDIGQHEANDQTVEWLKQIGVLVQVYPEPTTNSDLIDIGLVDEVEK